MSTFYYTKDAVLFPEDKTKPATIFHFAIGNKETILSDFPTYSEVSTSSIWVEAIKKSLTDAEKTIFMVYYDVIIKDDISREIRDQQGLFINLSDTHEKIEGSIGSILELRFKDIIKKIGKKK